MSSGGYSCFRLPTALAEMIRSTPSILNPNILARKLSSDGSRRWPAPCLARNATRFPRSVPIRYGPDGSPNGVFNDCSSRSLSPAMSYRPLPPMTPIWTFKKPSWLRSLGQSSNLLDVPLAVLFANIPGGNIGVVLEDDQILALNRFLQEGSFEVQRVEREEIVTHHPHFRQVRSSRQQVSCKNGGLAGRFDHDDLVMHGVAAGAPDAHARHDRYIVVD